jgi:DNA (cytosine-5)-methyltransferase 1
MTSKLVDLFCGIGMGSLGFVRVGFEIIAAVDIDAGACAIYEENLCFKPIVADLRRISGADILKRTGLKRGELDVCTGCPPCQAFSTLRRTRLQEGQRDHRKSLLRVLAQHIEDLLPRVVVLENVRGLTFGTNRRFLNDFLSQLERLGYRYDFGVLDAANFGIPQHRHRLIVIGSREGTPSLPQHTHSNPTAAGGKALWRTVRDAISDLPPLKAGQKCETDHLHQASAHSETVLQVISSIPHDGGGRRSLPRRLWLPCHKKLAENEASGAGSIYGRMRWDTPSPTITTRSHTPSCGRFVHPSQDRSITLREAARLQTIPDDFSMRGSKEEIGRWIGNAMPLGLSEVLARAANKCL